MNRVLKCRQSLSLQWGRERTYNPLIIQRSSFFSNDQQSKRKEYKERRLLGYSMEQMYHVVADVESYVHFVPWCTSSNVSNKTDRTMLCHVSVGFPPINESYISKVTLDKPSLVKSVATDGFLFHHLCTIWQFRPGLPDNKKTCVLDFSIDFQFRSVLYSQVSQVFFDQLVKMNVEAFLKRANELYGPESIKKQKPHIITDQK